MTFLYKLAIVVVLSENLAELYSVKGIKIIISSKELDSTIT